MAVTPREAIYTIVSMLHFLYYRLMLIFYDKLLAQGQLNMTQEYGVPTTTSPKVLGPLPGIESHTTRVSHTFKG